jgi:hypothetical protein
VSRWTALLALVLLGAACGDAGGSAQTSPSPSAKATASPKPQGTPKVFTIGPAAGVQTPAKGTVTVTSLGTGSVAVQLNLTNLPANSSHISHIHLGSCTQKGGIAFALNQVVADGTGAAATRTTFKATYPPATGHWYVVVHAGPDMQGSNSSYLLCGNLF